jgi:hypothetical protein
MNLIGRYIFWTYERGSFHYDVMVTVILLFLFISPHYIDFKEKPVQAVPTHKSEVLVREQGSTGTEARFVYEIRVDDLHGAKSDEELKAAILSVVQPMAGDVTLEKCCTPVLDSKGNIVAYDATISR